MGCCYEFHVGSVCYTYDYENKKTQHHEQDEHTMHPFQTVTIVTEETVSLNDRQFLQVFAKGSLFALGLAAVFTAADPGFKAPLGITMTNLSPRSICLREGDAFLKGCFFEMQLDVEKPYVGQHGAATMSWP